MKRTYGKRELPNSAVKYVLESLVPYTDANLKLAFSPNAFFNDLENIDRQKAWHKNYKQQKYFKREGLRGAFYRAQKQGLIVLGQDNNPRLTEKGWQAVRPYEPSKLGKSACLMVTFDIPEAERAKRRHLRTLLKELSFIKKQQSLWISEYDHRSYLKSEIKALGLQDYVQVYESARII